MATLSRAGALSQAPMPYTEPRNAPESIHTGARPSRLASATPVSPRVFEDAYVLEKTMGEWWKARCLKLEAELRATSRRFERALTRARAHASALPLRAAARRLRRPHPYARLQETP